MISQKVENDLRKGSWIRAMFEQGEKLRKDLGESNVYDFTLGNPDPEPPAKVHETIRLLLDNHGKGLHKYMNNAGFPDVRAKISEIIKEDTSLEISSSNIIMTCGAAGGLNVVLKTVLNPQDEVIIFAPYFVEYMFYIENHGGKPVICPTDEKTFYPDMRKLAESITERTKAIIINSPNNPTGVVYSRNILNEIAKILSERESQFGTQICVISDEPYVKLVYDNVEVPNVMTVFKNVVIVNSYSKSLSLAGERVGYIAVSPNIENNQLFVNGLVFANRTLGFVNAPAMFQKVIAAVISENVDVNVYKERRDMLYNSLTKFGYECVKPEGAFYLFPKSPLASDVDFVKHALKYNLLLVPGSGFGMPGYFRVAYCVSMNTISNSLPAFEKAVKEL